MADMIKRPADTYSPLYFLASLGAGGIAVTFFMFLMFWVPHPGRPVPVFEDIAAAFAQGGVPMQTAIVIAALGIATFVFLNIKSLLWNLSAYSAGAFRAAIFMTSAAPIVCCLQPRARSLNAWRMLRRNFLVMLLCRKSSRSSGRAASARSARRRTVRRAESRL